ncbi:MAG TPA: alpha/beta hydrolase [Longimicrobium sp.]|nr:alpha/beta hydrolase [Longimicrobium sp.]
MATPPADRPLRLGDRVEQIVARVLVRLPPRLQLLLSGEPAVTVDGQTLDPHVQLVRALRRRRNRGGLCEPTPEKARARFRREGVLFRGPVTSVGSVRDFDIPGPGGPLRVRHYLPDARKPRPLTVYLHGGGYVIGDLDTHDEACRILCRHAGVHVLSVDYRLAPEHPFPAALDDTLAALRWAQAHAAELGADPARIAVGGDSAGGNLAAVAAQLTVRDRPPFAQLLIYPPTDSETRRPSQTLFSEGWFLSQGDRDTFARHYLEGTGVTGRDPRVSPLLATELSGLAPALVVTAGFDILRDEAEAYRDALEEAGTTARLTRISGHGHGFLHMTGVSPGARAAMVRMAEDWRALLEEVGRG